MSGGVSKRVQANRKSGLDDGGFKKSGSGSGVGMPPMLRRFAEKRAPAVRGGKNLIAEPRPPYRYFKMVIIKIRVNTGTVCQMSEFAFYEQNETNINLNGLSISNPGGNYIINESPEKLIDGNTNTKWNISNYSSNNTSIIIDFGTDYINKPVPKLYKWATANDADYRDPISWTISGSNDNTNWVVLDSQNNYATTTVRKTYVPTTGYFSLTY